jgi:hypothetical protein
LIPHPCPECGETILCEVREPGFGQIEKEYREKCPYCHKKVPLDLPGEPIRPLLCRNTGGRVID